MPAAAFHRVAAFKRTGAMSEQLQFIIVVAFGALCFGCGYLVAFIVARNKWRREMIRRGAARYNSETGKWEWGELPKKPKTWEVQ
jgi:hypothetical protein